MEAHFDAVEESWRSAERGVVALVSLMQVGCCCASRYGGGGSGVRVVTAAAGGAAPAARRSACCWKVPTYLDNVMVEKHEWQVVEGGANATD